MPALALLAGSVLASGVTGSSDDEINRAVSRDPGSERYDPASHKPKKSAGCGKKSPYKPGKSVAATAKTAGVKWTYRVYVPKAYDKATPMPLIVHHPGWGLSAQSEEDGAGITALADSLGYISVTAQGMDDNPHSGGPWFSWNVVGSTQSPGPGGATCTSKADPNQEYCYTSCSKKHDKNNTQQQQPRYADEVEYGSGDSYDASYGGYTYSYGGSGGGGGGGGVTCSDSPQCWWTTCEETITPTGTGRSKVVGFVPQLYDTLESQLCIDLSREYASGESNGGMMTWQLGVDLASRLAAIAPEFGSFHRGFAMAPQMRVPTIDLHGSQDTTVPSNVSLSGDGYYYTTTHEILNGGKYSKGWKAANGCDEQLSHWKTKYDGQSGFWCVSECKLGDVVRCMWDGGHNWLFNSATPNGWLVTTFLLQWTKTSHVGFGATLGGPNATANLLTDITVHDTDPTPSPRARIDALPMTLTPTPTYDAHGKLATPAPHYGNPSTGCRHDEDVVIVGANAQVCAPRVAVSTDEAEDVAASPLSEAILERRKQYGDPLPPSCRLGGNGPQFLNGCPLDADTPAHSRAWPICLGKGLAGDDDPYTNGQFHCLLVCPCVTTKRGDGGDDGYNATHRHRPKMEPAYCDADAHSHCPTGAVCERGQLRNMAQGVCVFKTTITNGNAR